MQRLKDHWPRLLELFVLFGVFPVLLIHTEDIFPVIPTLLIVFGVLLVILRLDGWSYRELLILGEARQWRAMLALYVAAAVCIAAAVKLFWPESFLSFPQSDPGRWLLVMALYPLVSALPQEFMYRTFLFTRYGGLFGDNKWALILLSGLLFMWGHILFMNPVALFATLIGGLLFAWRYYHSRSLLLATVEHALYGNLFFTLGLGRFIFSGMV